MEGIEHDVFWGMHILAFREPEEKVGIEVLKALTALHDLSKNSEQHRRIFFRELGQVLSSHGYHLGSQISAYAASLDRKRRARASSC